MTSKLYTEWNEAKNKGSQKFYASEQFRQDYTRLEMESKERLFRQRTQRDVQKVLRNIKSQSDRTKIRILSLGCGPGSDLLGILGAVSCALKSGDAGLQGWQNGELRCECIGVDSMPWNWSAFEQKLSGIKAEGALREVDCQFVEERMALFVYRIQKGEFDTGFDFICLSFAEVARHLQLIGRSLHPLLTTFGRVLVLDNDIPNVWRLKGFNFKPRGGYNGVCMYVKKVPKQTQQQTQQLDVSMVPGNPETQQPTVPGNFEAHQTQQLDVPDNPDTQQLDVPDNSETQQLDVPDNPETQQLDVPDNPETQQQTHQLEVSIAQGNPLQSMQQPADASSFHGSNVR